MIAMTNATLDEKYERLQRILRDLQSVAVAFSAGVDSTFLLRAAVDTLGADKVVAVTGRSDSLARSEFEQASVLAKQFGAEHVVVDTGEFDNPQYTANPTNRCYFCKTNLYEHLRRFIAERSLEAVVCGTNADDLGDFRPGLDAATEHGVRSPVAEAGLTKAEVRELSRRLGLPTFDKPASPCLSSRVPYGQPVTPEKLRMIEAGEAYLHELGIAECRVRHHEPNYESQMTSYELRVTNHETRPSQAANPDPQSAIRNRKPSAAGAIARIEVPAEFIPVLAEPETAAKLDAHFRSLGYDYVALDLRGFRSGSMNEVIGLRIAD